MTNSQRQGAHEATPQEETMKTTMKVAGITLAGMMALTGCGSPAAGPREDCQAVTASELATINEGAYEWEPLLAVSGAWLPLPEPGPFGHTRILSVDLAEPDLRAVFLADEEGGTRLLGGDMTALSYFTWGAAVDPDFPVGVWRDEVMSTSIVREVAACPR